MLHAPNKTWGGRNIVGVCGHRSVPCGPDAPRCSPYTEAVDGFEIRRLPKHLGPTLGRMQKSRCPCAGTGFRGRLNGRKARTGYGGQYRIQESRRGIDLARLGTVKAAACPHEVPGRTIGAERTAGLRTTAKVPAAAALTPKLSEKQRNERPVTFPRTGLRDRTNQKRLAAGRGGGHLVEQRSDGIDLTNIGSTQDRAS